MSFGRKLSRLTSAGPGTRPAQPDPPAITVDPNETSDDEPVSDGWDAFRSALRSKVTREGKRPESARASMELPGVVEQTAFGPLRRIVTSRPLDDAHGGVAHRELLGIDTKGIARFALDEDFLGIDPARMVFLDTETTGLAGGTGTVPFLVGIGRVDGGEWVVEQWLLERFGQEAPILRRLAEVLAESSALVTYNGKSFDWPLLRARYVLHRLPVPGVPRHLDLVHGARRVLKDRLESVRLADVERELLDFERDDDVHGSEIPAIYLEFQRSGTHPDLPRVIRHHALDLVAMPAMLVRFARLFTGEALPEFAEDRLACAKVVARSTQDDSSRTLVRSLLADVDAHSGDARVAFAAELILAADARRAGDLDGERAALERACERARNDADASSAATALAKQLEHRAKDLDAALTVAERAHRLAPDDATARRVERLRTRLAATLADRSRSE